MRFRGESIVFSQDATRVYVAGKWFLWLESSWVISQDLTGL